MKEQFVTYEITLKLKELGFNKECLAAFSDDEYHDLLHLCENHTEGNFTIESSRYRIKAPLWQQVIDWFREKYNIHISLLPHNDVEFGIRIRYNKSTLIHGGYKSYEEAREQAILKAIEICQKK